MVPLMSNKIDEKYINDLDGKNIKPMLLVME
jgi:hypothetical protein